jgi:hypothetical protein
MTISSTTTLLLFVGWALSLLPCSAQNADKVSLQFLSFPKSITPEPVELVIGKNKSITVEIPSNELSPVYKVKRQSQWSVGESTTDEESKPLFKIFGQGKVLNSPKQLILLVRKGKKNSDGFDVLVIDNRIAHFGGGKFLFMNAAQVDIAGIVGNEKFAIQPSKHAIIKPEPDKNNRRVCHTLLYYRKGRETKPFLSSKWPLSGDARGLIFFYHDPRSKQLRLHSIRDFLPKNG